MARSLESISDAAGDFLERGEPARALELYAKAVTIAEASGRQSELSSLLGDMAVAYRRTGDIPSAVRTNRRAIEIARSCGNNLDIARWSGNLGGLLLSDDLAGAEACFREAVEAAARSGVPAQMSIAAGHLAGLMGERGRFSEAIEIMATARGHANVSREVAAIISDQELALFTRWTYSLRKEHRLREARDAVNRALAARVGEPRARGDALLLMLLAEIEENDGDIEAACGAIRRAIETHEALGNHDDATQLRDLERRMRG